MLINFSEVSIYNLPDSVFFNSMKSTVMYIFELCDIGKAPDVKEVKKKPKPLSPAPLFDNLED